LFSGKNASNFKYKKYTLKSEFIKIPEFAQTELQKRMIHYSKDLTCTSWL